MVKQLNIPDFTPEDVKLKIKSICSPHFSELAKVLKSEKKVVLTETISMYLNYSGSNKLIYCCILFVLQDSHYHAR
jgi:hypothetical protein